METLEHWISKVRTEKPHHVGDIPPKVLDAIIARIKGHEVVSLSGEYRFEKSPAIMLPAYSRSVDHMLRLYEQRQTYVTISIGVGSGDTSRYSVRIGSSMHAGNELAMCMARAYVDFFKADL